MMLLDTREGIIVNSAVVNLPLALAANAVLVYTIPVLVGQLVGLKSVKIRRVNLYNNAAGNTQVVIGNGIPCVAIMPALDSMNGLSDQYGPETDLISVETFANITAYPTALAGAGTIDIQLELVIIG
jgi:hypothetical protein